jgi:hypothetical protein
VGQIWAAEQITLLVDGIKNPVCALLFKSG